MTRRLTEIPVGKAGVPAWFVILAGLLCGGVAAALIQYLSGAGTPIQTWALSLLLLLLASGGIVYEIIKALLGSGRLSLDLLAPHIAFPVVYALLYSVGGLRSAYLQAPSPSVPLYSYYFLGLAAFGGGLLLVALLTQSRVPRRAFDCEWLSNRTALDLKTSLCVRLGWPHRWYT